MAKKKTVGWKPQIFKLCSWIEALYVGYVSLGSDKVRLFWGWLNPLMVVWSPSQTIWETWMCVWCARRTFTNKSMTPLDFISFVQKKGLARLAKGTLVLQPTEGQCLLVDGWPHFHLFANRRLIIELIWSYAASKSNPLTVCLLSRRRLLLLISS